MEWKNYTISNDQRFHLNSKMLPAYEQQFDSVMAFHSPGLAPVLFDKKAWHIHPDGSEAYIQRFDHSFGFYGDRAAVANGNNWFHILTNGTPAYNERYSWVGNFQGGCSTVRDHEGYYFHINISGERLYKNKWSYCGDYRESIAVVQDKTGKSTHINYDGTHLHDIWFDDLDVFHKGYARAKFLDGWAHINRQGQAIYPHRFAVIEPFYNGQSRVESFDGSYKVIDQKGISITVLRPATRSEFSSLSSDMVGFWRTQTIATAVELGLIDALPATVHDIKKKYGLDSEASTRLLRALAELEIVIKKDEQWVLSTRGKCLHSTSPFTLADAAKEYGHYFPKMWSDLSKAIKSYDVWKPSDIFNDFSQDEQRRIPHHRMLQSYARHDYNLIPEILKLNGDEKIIDAGGGLGTLAKFLTEYYPNTHITVLDRLEVIEQAKACSDDEGINWVSGNLFENWKVQASAIILARVLHDWDDHKAESILHRARESISKGDVIYIIEMLLHEDTFEGSLCDLHLLMVTGGKERTENEYKKLLNKSGFELKEVRSINALPSILVAVAC